MVTMKLKFSLKKNKIKENNHSTNSEKIKREVLFTFGSAYVLLSYAYAIKNFIPLDNNRFSNASSNLI